MDSVLKLEARNRTLERENAELRSKLIKAEADRRVAERAVESALANIKEMEETVAWKAVEKLGGVLTGNGQWLKTGLKIYDYLKDN